MDVFGPYIVSDGKQTRRTTDKKCWALILTCLNSRATHIEALPSLDISSLKNAIRRFISIRGDVKLFRCDQGSNFIGLFNQDTKTLDLAKELNLPDQVWHINPPKASHHGGIWERSIQSVKNILHNSLHQLKGRTLTRDELYTYLAECASIMNNSPLWEYSSDPNDPRPLTPGMLLTLRADSPQVRESFDDSNLMSYGKNRWKKVQYLSDQFWKRWRTDYLQNLQRRNKWTSETRSFQPGDVVLLKDSQCKRYQWPIAKILSVRKSTDGLVRSVTLLVATRYAAGTRILCRPVTDLALLVPVE